MSDGGLCAGQARHPGGPLTSLACWALTGSAYCSSAWNWLFLVKVMIFRTVPNLEKICERRGGQPRPSDPVVQTRT